MIGSEGKDATAQTRIAVQQEPAWLKTRVDEGSRAQPGTPKMADRRSGKGTPKMAVRLPGMSSPLTKMAAPIQPVADRLGGYSPTSGSESEDSGTS
ncbi:hypothetical protein EOD39_13074 [Acipenser ruthenus]|uniref:Uncharacterized protein n=1 Tax=Acipenser ruthenus TaxID=7906 RepID=A0A444UJM6_ACIRT|nr:hypothetical protein EOD39_13074 [Acipenser ruthenus]